MYKGKDMTVDSTFQFERKRDEPIQYNRELYVRTVQAMKRIQKIRSRREKDFIIQRQDFKITSIILFRLRAGKAKQKGLLEREISRDIDLVEPRLKESILPKIQQVQEEEEKQDFIEKPSLFAKVQRKKKDSNVGIDIE